MSDFHSLRTIPPDPAEPRGSALHIALMWIVVLISAAIIAADNFRAPFSAATNSSASAAADPNIGLELSGRYVVGVWALNHSHPDHFPRLVAQLDTLTTGPSERLRVAIVAGLVEGPSAAIHRIDDLRPQLDPDPSLRRDADVLSNFYSGDLKGITAPDRQRLIDRYHWFGQLALATGASSQSPAWQAAIAPALRTLITLGALGLLLIVAFVTGLVLCILAIIWLAMGKVSFGYRPPGGANVLLIEAFAVYVASVAVVGQIFRGWAGPPGAAGVALRIAVTVGIAVVPILWPLLRGMPGSAYRQAIGWHTGQGAMREIGVGILAYVGGLPIMAVGFLITASLMSLTGYKPNPHPIIRLIGQSPGRTAELFLLASVYAPIAEETLFRGALFSHLRGRLGWLISASIASLIFAALHPQGWVAIPILFFLAMVLAALREWRGSILASMTTHALNNTIMLLFLTLCLS